MKLKGYLRLIMAGNYSLPAPMNKHIEIQADEIVYGLNDLNRLYDALEHFKPVTISSYAKSKGVSVQSVYKRIKNGKLITLHIDGCVFVID